ncbi:hypothetical protein HPP92_020124 [Vanilla planifolia]|uniref:Uncharacterized protein n=1 Tax=Vanilla planifolia TaxID=51239 RepID=A0A835Q4H4_VANPL|nr:hypothetical protein HPP92_020124 [Vanilla planifolia]
MRDPCRVPINGRRVDGVGRREASAADLGRRGREERCERGGKEKGDRAIETASCSISRSLEKLPLKRCLVIHCAVNLSLLAVWNHSLSETLAMFLHGISLISLCSDNTARFSSMGQLISSKQKEDSSFQILDIIRNNDDLVGDLDGHSQVSSFCGSPPVRSHNPVVHDAYFTRHAQSFVSCVNNPCVTTKSSDTVDRGALCGSPKVRIEGVSC